MVVDDSAICLDIVRMQLEDGGFEVVTVDSPFGLSSALSAAQPDVVLVDVSMPGLSGDKLVEITLRSVPAAKRVPIVLHSDKPPEELRHLALDCGAAGYIVKGSDAEALIREVRRFIGA